MVHALQLGGVQPPGRKHAEFLQGRFEAHWRLAEPVQEFVRTPEFHALLASHRAPPDAGAAG